MRQIHRASEKLFIDYAEPTIALTDGSRAHILEAALDASSYTFACAPSRNSPAVAPDPSRHSINRLCCRYPRNAMR